MWPERVALDTDVNYIVEACLGRIEMLQMVVGTPKKDRPIKPTLDAAGRPIELTPGNFDEMFDRSAPRHAGRASRAKARN